MDSGVELDALDALDTLDAFELDGVELDGVELDGVELDGGVEPVFSPIKLNPLAERKSVMGTSKFMISVKSTEPPPPLCRSCPIVFFVVIYITATIFLL